MSTEGGQPSQSEKIEALRRRLSGEEAPPPDELVVEGVPVGALARAHGTPFYVYGAGALDARITGLRDALEGAVDLYYSLKANPSLGLCQRVAAAGLGAEIASGGELVLARAAGFPASRTLFAGPGKTDEELRAAVAAGVESVNVESMGELERLAAICAAGGLSVPVALRVNPARPLGGARMRMGGGAQQFGIPEEAIGEALARIAASRSLRLVGVHVYVGTQIFEAEAFLDHCDQVLDIARRVAGAAGRALSLVDLGGGFGVPYFEGTPVLDVGEVAKGLVTRVAAARRDPRLARARFVLELGRHLVADCGVYVTRVLDVKVVRGRTFAVVDGGMHHHIMATGNFGQVFRRPYPIDRVAAVMPGAASAGGERRPFTLAGPCCTPLDVLGWDVRLPMLSPGDLLGVFYSGAYGYSASSIAFLSHPAPAEILVDGGRVHLLRSPGRFEAVLDGQHPLGTGAALAAVRS